MLLKVRSDDALVPGEQVLEIRKCIRGNLKVGQLHLFEKAHEERPIQHQSCQGFLFQAVSEHPSRDQGDCRLVIPAASIRGQMRVLVVAVGWDTPVEALFQDVCMGEDVLDSWPLTLGVLLNPDNP